MLIEMTDVFSCSVPSVESNTFRFMILRSKFLALASCNKAETAIRY